MKTVLIGINAKFIHSNLAIHSIRLYGKERGLDMSVAEFTINHQLDDILDQLYVLKADVLAFSCYIWNIDMIQLLLGELHKIMPETRVILGGPGVSFDSPSYLERYKAVDFVVSGEGEAVMYQLIRCIESGEDYSEISGISFRTDKGIRTNPQGSPLDMSTLPFIYDQDFHTFDNRILYYESSRGCPYNCQYCLSSIDKGVRYRDIESVKQAFQWFLDHQVRQVKLVDRTFNCHPKRTEALLKYLVAHDNGITLFHFEVAADILTDEIITVLNQARPGQFQLEIGIQSTFEETLDIIQRKTDFEQIKTNVKRIQAPKNVHIHLDLIAGLPKEGYNRFSQSFDDVYGLRPDQLQLGFLKVLKGTGMRQMAQQYGLVFRDYAPYEILSTYDIGHDEMVLLKRVESVLELFYNSGHFKHTLQYMEGFFLRAFTMYEALGKHFEAAGGHLVKHAKLSLYDMLRDFGLSHDCPQTVLESCLKYDLMLNEKIKKYPTWLTPDVTFEEMRRRFYQKAAETGQYVEASKADSVKTLNRRYHLERFDYDVKKLEAQKVVVLFDYEKRSHLNHGAMTHQFTWEAFERMCDDE